MRAIFLTKENNVYRDMKISDAIPEYKLLDNYKHITVLLVFEKVSVIENIAYYKLKEWSC